MDDGSQYIDSNVMQELDDASTQHDRERVEARKRLERAAAFLSQHSDWELEITLPLMDVVADQVHDEWLEGYAGWDAATRGDRVLSYAGREPVESQLLQAHIDIALTLVGIEAPTGGNRWYDRANTRVLAALMLREQE